MGLFMLFPLHTQAGAFDLLLAKSRQLIEQLLKI